MSFVSISFKTPAQINCGDAFIIVDSELGDLNIETNTGREDLCVAKIVATAKAYSKRNLPVGKNLALATIYCVNETGWHLKDITKEQDVCCPKYIPNWTEYAKERDGYLEKVLSLL